jgi:hypothetical protein
MIFARTPALRIVENVAKIEAMLDSANSSSCSPVSHRSIST